MDFSDIALAKLLQTVPELGNYILTFKDVSEELQDDTGIQVGIFVLRVGAELFYVPVVSKNDNVYPIDSIFFDSKKKFFPLTKKTVALVTSPSQLEPGKATDIPKHVDGNPSVYNMISPPRTGKFVYASASRLTDFLASLPEYLKEATMTKFAAEKSVYDSLDKMYGLKAIFDVLRPKPSGMAAVTNEAPISVVTDANPSMSTDQISSILNDGFHVSGSQPQRRVAVSIQDYNSSGVLTNVTNLDGDRDFEIMLSNGTSREAYIPKMYTLGSKPRGVTTSLPGVEYNEPNSTFAIFTNGDYAVGDRFIAVGQTLDRRTVLETLFEYSPPVLLKELVSGDVVAISLADGSFIGPFRVSRVSLNSYGVEIKGVEEFAYKQVTIYGYRNLPGNIEVKGKDIFIPFTSIVLKLGSNVTSQLEVSLNAASCKRHMNEIQWLGDELNLGYDGIEFAINGKVAGVEADVMKRLVVTEGIDPEVASTFVKQAKETKFTKIYMTKRAGFNDTGDIQSEGTALNDEKEVGLNGSFKDDTYPGLVPNVQESLKANDAQITEATIISELLQSPDMYEAIGEYLPDIEEAIDKLGRTLFMARVHVGKLAESSDADQVYAFLASLKTVYRLLGDNYLKLQQMCSVHSSLETPDKAAKPTVK
jgi:hypothetical protein